MKISKNSFLLCLSALALIACKKDDPVIEPTGVNEYTQPTLDLGASLTTGYFGRVSNSAGEGIWGATVYCGTNTATTDANGVYKIEMTTGKTDQAFVSVSKDGYFSSGRSFVPVPNAYNYSEITLQEKSATGYFVTGEPQVVILQPGFEVEFQGMFVDAVGNDYTGLVYTSLAKSTGINSVEETAKVGGPFGQDANGQAKFFETYGGLSIHLEGAQGQTLEIAEGSSAEIRVRIDASQLTDAPAELALSYFNGSAGYWVQDTVGRLVGDQYIGTVSHLGAWSFAEAKDISTIEGATLNDAGDTLFNFPIQMITQNGKAIMHSSSSGIFRANVPATIQLDMQAIDKCGTGTSAMMAGPFPAGMSNPYDIQLSAGLVTLNRQFGTLKGCSAQNLLNGYVIIEIDGEHYPQLVKNGAFNIDNINCTGATSFTVSGTDLNSAETSLVKDKILFSPLSNAGDVFACANYNEYISFSIDSGPSADYYSNLYCAQLDTGGGWFFKIYPDDFAIQIYGNTFTPGNYVYSAVGQPNTVRVHPSQMAQFQSFNITTDLLQYGDVDEYVTMTFSGFFTDATLTTHTIDGDLIVVRDF